MSHVFLSFTVQSSLQFEIQRLFYRVDHVMYCSWSHLIVKLDDVISGAVIKMISG
jgi:hypothetical protein